MKHMGIAVLLLAGTAAAAGEDLQLDGKFRLVRDGMPVKWTLPAPETGRLTGSPPWSARALELTAEKSAARAVSRETFPVTRGQTLEVEADVRGAGTAFLAAALLDSRHRVVAEPRLASLPVTAERREIKGKLRLSDWADKHPVEVRIVLGVDPGGKVEFTDVEAELERD